MHDIAADMENFLRAMQTSMQPPARIQLSVGLNDVFLRCPHFTVLLARIFRGRFVDHGSGGAQDVRG
jgi:hypothetical protein